MPQHKSDQTKIKPENTLQDQKHKKFSRGQRRAPKKITERYLHNAGLYYLERFAASKKHFKTVMNRKVKRSCMHHPDQDYDSCTQMVDALADKFENLGLLDDTVYTRGVVTSLRRKGLSRKAILNKMRMKGIDADKTQEMLAFLDEEYNETQEEAEKKAALKLAKKKKVGPFFIGEEPDIKKALGVFARAGFSYQMARYVLDLTHDDIEDMIF